jgi:hypothetical protein
MSETAHATADGFDEQITHCVHCGAIEQPAYDIRLRLESLSDGYSQIVCNVCVPEGDA